MTHISVNFVWLRTYSLVYFPSCKRIFPTFSFALHRLGNSTFVLPVFPVRCLQDLAQFIQLDGLYFSACLRICVSVQKGFQSCLYFSIYQQLVYLDNAVASVEKGILFIGFSRTHTWHVRTSKQTLVIVFFINGLHPECRSLSCFLCFRSLLCFISTPLLVNCI